MLTIEARCLILYFLVIHVSFFYICFFCSLFLYPLQWSFILHSSTEISLLKVTNDLLSLLAIPTFNLAHSILPLWCITLQALVPSLAIVFQSKWMTLILNVGKHQQFSPKHLSYLHFLLSWYHPVSWLWIAFIYRCLPSSS